MTDTNKLTRKIPRDMIIDGCAIQIRFRPTADTDTVKSIKEMLLHSYHTVKKD